MTAVGCRLLKVALVVAPLVIGTAALAMALRAPETADHTLLEQVARKSNRTGWWGAGGATVRSRAGQRAVNQSASASVAEE